MRFQFDGPDNTGNRNGMKQAFEQTQTILKKLTGLNQAHLQTFDQAAMPDLDRQTRERASGIKELKASIDKLTKLANDCPGEETESMLVQIKTRISDILEQNRILTDRVLLLKAEIKSGMIRVSKGKTAIRSYSSPEKRAVNPRVISITN